MKTSVTLEEVADFIVDYQTTTLGKKTTAVTATLKNGFEITETSACVDEANYSQVIGAQYCREGIIKKVWNLLGFKLQCELADRATAIEGSTELP